MIDTGGFVPAFRYSEFCSFAESRSGKGIEHIPKDDILRYASIFIYGEEDKPDTIIKETILEKTEEEIYEEIVLNKFNDIDWTTIDEVSWYLATINNGTENVFAVEAIDSGVTKKRIVIKDRKKSLGFMSYINKLRM